MGLPLQLLVIHFSLGKMSLCTLNLHAVQVAEACRLLDEKYTPPLTFIIVQKRHSTRMFPTDGNIDTSKNVLPGGPQC